MLPSRFSTIFGTHPHHKQPIEGPLATALSTDGALSVEVSFDRETAPTDEFLYVDLTDSTDSLCLHFSFRLQENYMVLNTRNNGVWSTEHVAVGFDFSALRFWRFLLVVEEDGTMRIQLGNQSLCQMKADFLTSSDIAFAASNVSVKSVLRPECAATEALALGQKLPEERAVVLSIAPAGGLEAEAISVEQAGTPLDTSQFTVHKAHGDWWRLDLDVPLSSDLAVKLGEVTVPVQDIVAGPAVEISAGYLAFRTGVEAENQEVVWRGGADGEQNCVVRLSIGGDENDTVNGQRFQRFFTPLSEFLRRFEAWDHYNAFTLHAPGLNSARFDAHVSAACFSALEKCIDAATSKTAEASNELQMAFLDWWNVLHQPDLLPEIRARHPLLWQHLNALSEGEVKPFQDAKGTIGAVPEGPKVDDLAYWNALREIDAVIHSASSETFRTRVLTSANALSAEKRKWFILLLAADLMRFNLEDLLVREVADAFLNEVVSNPDSPLAVSSGIAVLVARNEVGRAAGVMEGLTSTHCGGLDIRPISESLVKVMQSAAPNEVQRRFVYAFQNVIRNMHSYGHSSFRHHQVIDALIKTLAVSNMQPEWFLQDIVWFVEEQYSTVPEFWRTLDQTVQDNPGLRFPPTLMSLARRARAANSWIQQVTISADGTLAEMPEAAKIVSAGERREYLETFLKLNGTNDEEGRTQLSTLDVHMELRKAAHPFPDLQARFKDPMRAVVQDLLPYPALPHHAFVRDVGEALFNQDAELVQRLLAPEVHRLNRIDDVETEAVLLDALSWSLPPRNADPALLNQIALQLIERLDLHQENINRASPSLMSAASRLLRRPVGSPETAYIYEKLQELVPDHVRSAVSEVQEKEVFFSDTLIGIVTCRPYLETRAKECRDTWVKDLKAAGVNVLFFCGSDKLSEPARHDEQEGVVYLPVGDAYEDLPAKMLEMFQWIRLNRSENFVLKIDDDCYLDTKNFLTSLAYRRAHYFGRPLHSRPDAFDREWHQLKSKNRGAQRAIDTSLTGTYYADGGGSYTLSRHALNALATAATTPTGLQLRISSFFEDKMMGDLLELADIKLAHNGYTTMQARKTHNSGHPVLVWGDRSFYPTANNGIAVAHLDRQGKMAELQSQRDSSKLAPARVWPMQTKPTLSWQDNMLELLTDADIHGRVADAELVCVAAVRNEMGILPHFLDHYRRLGVDLFLIADNLSDDGTREFLLDQPDVLLFSAANQYRDSHFGVEWQRVLLDHFCAGRWVVLADADEFLLPPENVEGGLKTCCQDLEQRGYDAAQVMMVDMYPKSSLSAADFTKDTPAKLATCLDREPAKPWHSNTGPFGNMTCYTSSLRHRLMPLSAPYLFTAQKVALFRFSPLQSYSEGFHFGAGMKLAPEPLAFLHYKYSAEFAEKARTEVARGQHYGGASEYRTYLDLVEKGLDSFWEDGTSKEVDVTVPNALADVLSEFVCATPSKYNEVEESP